MTEKPQKTEVVCKAIVACSSCKKGIPCNITVKISEKDVLLRIVRFQAAMRRMKAKDSLLALVGEIATEIIRLRKNEEKLRGYGGVTQPKYLPPEYTPPEVDTCPFCNKNRPCSIATRKNRIDILDRVAALRERLKDRRTKEPLYCILEDSLLEIRNLRSRLEILKGRK